MRKDINSHDQERCIQILVMIEKGTIHNIVPIYWTL